MLLVSEVFKSIQGESTHAGRPCVFIRLTGCNLHCRYCDTEYARDGGDFLTVEQIIQRADVFSCGLAEITGGEPLQQQETPLLCSVLLNAGYEVLVETNGSKDIDLLPDEVKRIMDIKCPSSGETGRINWQNISRLRAGDELKFVLSDREDYIWAVDRLDALSIPLFIPVLFSPVINRLSADVLAHWILKDGLNVRLQLQLHKIIWPDQERGV